MTSFCADLSVRFPFAASCYRLLFILLLVFGRATTASSQQLAPVWAEASPLTTGAEGNNANTGLYQTAVGPKNAIYVAGGLQGTATFGSLQPTLAHAGAYVGRLADNGQWQWVKPINSEEVLQQPLRVTDLAVDKLGNVFVSVLNGFRDTDSVSFGPYHLKGNNFLAKLNAKGEWQWARSYSPLTLNAICPDGSGGVYIGGGYSQAFTLDGISLPNPQVSPGLYNTAAYTGRVSATGVLLSATRVGTSGTGTVTHLQVTQQGELMVAGELYAGTLRFSPTLQIIPNSTASNTFFAARLASNGTTWRWVNSYYGTGTTYLSGLTLDRAGNAYFHGDMYGTIDCARLTTGNRPVGRQYIARLTNTGQWNWAVGVNHDTYGPGKDRLVATATGDLYFCSTSRNDSVRAGTGWLRGPATRNGAPWGTSTAGNQRVPWSYVAKLRGSTGQWQWGVTAPSFALANSEIALDSLEQRLFVTGNLWPAVGGSRFNSTTTLTTGKNTGFLASLDTNSKQWLWATAQKVGGGTKGQQIAADKNGNLTVAGLLYGDCSFGSLPPIIAPYYGAFIARRTSDGHWLWAKPITGVNIFPNSISGEENLLEMAVDPAGNSYLSGRLYEDTATFDNFKIVPLHSDQTCFIGKISPAGQWLWVKPIRSIRGSRSESPRIAVDEVGRVTIVGDFTDSLTIDSTLFRSTYDPVYRRKSTDTYVARFSATGKLLWVQIPRGTGNERVASVCANQNGGVIIAGKMESDTIRLGTRVIASTRSRTAVQYVAGLDSMGVWQWTMPLYSDGTRISYPGAIKLKSNGDLVLSQYLGLGQIFLDTITINSTDWQSDMRFIACLAGDTHQWRWAAPIVTYPEGPVNTAPPTCYQLAIDAADRVIVAGNFTYPLVLDSVLTLPNTSGVPQAFVAQLDTVGHWNWVLTSQETGPSGRMDNRGVAAWKDQIYVTGAYTDQAQFGSYALPRNGAEKGYLARIAPPYVTASGDPDLWPNPARTTATLRLTAPSTGQPLYILDAIGRRIREQPFPAGTTQVVLSVQDLAPGMYFVRCGTVAKRLIVRP
jgi:hypothetical protein